jgi:hypothetical protein
MRFSIKSWWVINNIMAKTNLGQVAPVIITEENKKHTSATGNRNIYFVIG